MAAANASTELTLRGRVVAWLGALAAGAAWLGDDANARLAAALLTAPLVVDFAAKPRRLQRTAIRVLPRRTAAGATFTEHVELEHAGRWPLRECLITEPRTMRTEQSALLPTLLPGAPVDVEVRQRSLQRSHVHERVFLLSCLWPLGLFRTRAVVPVTAELVTEPARVPLPADVVRATASTEAAPRERSHLEGPEFHSLREHQPEEDARTVHALRSAALGTLVRRVLHGRMPRRVGIVLDLRRPPRATTSHGMRRFEWSLGACASLVRSLLAHGAELRVLVLGSPTPELEIHGPAQEVNLLTLLAGASPAPHQALAPGVLAAVQDLDHCYWIPAGSWFGANEAAGLPRVVTVVGGDVE
jgi:uncharacterized protein (DUF58 family)